MIPMLPPLPKEILENVQLVMETPMFVQKIYKLVESGQKEVIGWKSDGLSFVVYDLNRLQTELLPLYFNHSNFSSFIRQLHFYGFSKTSLSRTQCEFRHPYFIRDRPDMLPLIVRKTNESGSAQKRHIQELEERIKELEQENARLKAIAEDLPKSPPSFVDTVPAEPSAFVKVQKRAESPAALSPLSLLHALNLDQENIRRETNQFHPRIIHQNK